MLNIKINNEDVLCSNDFTIKKEMLNTPSVILNNVYPKTWEQNKDYVSRFYHPADYEQCLITDDTYYPYEEGITVEGTSFTLTDVDSTKESELMSVKGQTTQNGTPTPTTPIPINVVSGRQDVIVAGKNLFDKSKATRGKGVSTSTGNLYNESALFSTDYIEITPNISYVVNGYSTSANRVYGACYDDSKNYLTNVTTKANISTFIVTNTSAKYIRLTGFISDIDTYQLEKGSTATSYEAYKGNTYEINLGKNLLPNNSTTQTKSGVTYTVNQDKSITLNGTSTAGFIVEIASGLTLEKGTYTLSLKGKIQGCGIYAYAGSNVLKAYVSSSNTPDNWKTNFTLDSTTTFTQIRIDVQANKTFDNITIYPMIEKGSQATTYAPYKTPIELCKIGNYEDKIFKAIKGNEIYDSLSNEEKNTLDYGKWYLRKNIGKVVLDGSESGGRILDNNQRIAYNSVANPKLADVFIDTPDSVSNLTPSLSTHFSPTMQGRITTTNNSFGFSQWGGQKYIYISAIYDNIEDFKTWLSTHNTIVYYVLATPTTTEITDTELISQLESIRLLEGLNNIGISTPYLPFIMTLRYNHQEEHTDSDLIFCGVVKNSGEISLNPRQPHYSTLQILDYKTFLSEGELDTFVIADKTITEAIQMVIDDIAPYGFELGNISILNPNDVIGAYSTKDKSAYDVFNYIADITQSRWTTRVIDKERVAIDFYDPTLMDEGSSIEYNQAWFCQNKIIDMSYNYGTWDYRNKQVMTSQEVFGSIPQSQTIQYDGYATQIMTEFPIGYITAIYVNGVGKLFSTNEEKNIGITADFYYTPGNNFFEKNMSIGAGSEIVITYIPIVEGRQVITNADEITRVANATNVKGIISRYENRNDAITSDELQKIGQSYIKYKGLPEVHLTVKSELNLWDIGQRVQFNAPIDELDTEYMVKRKEINYIVTANKIFYTYELSSSFNSESAINYFDNQRAKANGNIKEGEYVSRSVDIENQAQIIFYDTTATEISITTNNSLQSSLETVLNG